jgi:lysophospholipase L1-like esterase
MGIFLHRIFRSILTSHRATVISTLGIVTVFAFLELRRGRISPLIVLRNSTTVVTAMNPPISYQRTHRILCYGDSLTAGTSGWDLYPYAPYLEQGLLELRDSVAVRHRGNPGMQAAEMAANLDGPRRGLRSAIQAVTDPSLSLVIILAGTNDLGYALLAAPNVETAAEEISSHLIALHTVCAELGVPRTLAVGIPPSGYQYVNEAARNLATLINERLQQFASQTEAESSTSAPQQEQQASKSFPVTYVPFPFAYEPDGDNWHSDTLHFSERGYRVLGESLVPVVHSILAGLDADDNGEGK